MGEFREVDGLPPKNRADVVVERGKEGIAKVMELTGGPAPVPAGYSAMDAREILKVMVNPSL